MIREIIREIIRFWRIAILEKLNERDWNYKSARTHTCDDPWYCENIISQCEEKK